MVYVNVFKQKKERMNMEELINVFAGEFEFLSNFKYGFTTDGKYYKSVEHYFQSKKTLDPDEEEKIRKAQTPSISKRLGRRAKLRPDWEDVKYDLMLYAVKCKFEQNPEIADKLINTKSGILIEGNNWHDNIWGNCRCSKCSGIKGQNLMGEILTKVRKLIQ